MTSYHRLTLGDLVLSGADLPETAYSFSTLGEDFTTGDAEPIERTIRTLLQDGAVTVSDGLSNRTATFQVMVEAPDSQALARGEAALAGELGKPNLLTWTPPDGWGPPTVFEVFTSSMNHIADDLREMQQSERLYQVRLVCHPTGRSVEPVEVQAIAGTNVTPTNTVIDAGSSLTAWAADSVYTTLSDAGSNLVAEGNAVREFSWSGSVDLTSTPYVSLDVAGVSITTAELQVNGKGYSTVARFPAGPPGSGIFRLVWRVTAPAVATKLGFVLTTNYPAFGISFYGLQRWDLLPLAGTGRQRMRTIDVAGSARTQGSLAIAATTSLGSVAVYTWSTSNPGYYPPLRPSRVSGGTATGDSTLVSGARDSLDTALVYEVPVSALIAGTHIIAARLRSDTNDAQSVTWTTQVRVNGSNVGAAMTGVRSVDFGSSPTTWRTVALARTVLPPTDIPGESSAVVRVTIVATAPGASNIDLDEAWLFNTKIGALSLVECGTGTAAAGGPSRRLWLDTPSTVVPRPAIYRGHSADRTDAFFAGADVQSWGVHEFAPGQTSVLLVTSGATDAEAWLRYYPRFHTHAYNPDVD